MSTAANTIAARLVAADYIATQETTASTTYADLATTGPTVTATTSASCIVAIYANMFNTPGTRAGCRYEISGATSDAANDNRAIQLQGTGGQHVGATFFHSRDPRRPGTNTFTAKYRCSTAGNATYSVRRLMVIPM